MPYPRCFRVGAFGNGFEALREDLFDRFTLQDFHRSRWRWQRRVRTRRQRKPAPAKGKPVCDYKVSIFVAPFVARKADGLFRLEPGYCQVSGCLRCLLLVMCTYPFAKKALTLHLQCGKSREHYFSCNLMRCKVLASSHQHLMAEAPRYRLGTRGGRRHVDDSLSLRRAEGKRLGVDLVFTIVSTTYRYTTAGM